MASIVCFLVLSRSVSVGLVVGVEGVEEVVEVEVLSGWCWRRALW